MDTSTRKARRSRRSPPSSDSGCRDTLRWNGPGIEVNWRGWVDWGVGPIGDMGAHLMDQSMWALDLGYPTTIETVSTRFNGVCYPHATMTFCEFPARGSRPPVKLTW